MLAAKQLLRGTELWKAFQGDRDDAYDAFSIHKLARGVEEALNACGLISSFRVTKWQQGAAGDRMYVEGMWVVHNVDDPRDILEFPTVGEGIDPGDKGLGKAISYARKNGMIQGLNLGIGMDNEATPSSQQRQPYGPTPSGGTPQQPAQPASRPIKPVSGNIGTQSSYVLNDLKGGAKTVPHAGMQAECWAVIANSITIRSLNEWVALNSNALSLLRANDAPLADLIDKLIAGRFEALKNRDAA